MKLLTVAGGHHYGRDVVVVQLAQTLGQGLVRHGAHGIVVGGVDDHGVLGPEAVLPVALGVRQCLQHQRGFVVEQSLLPLGQQLVPRGPIHYIHAISIPDEMMEPKH